MINVEKNNKADFLSFDEAMDSVVKEIDRILRSAPLIIKEYTKHLAASRGKNIRALSLITCAENNEGLIHCNAVRLAASVEILHLATLVHDDVIDDADIRRGEPTLQKKYGKKTAVICGDYLLSLALKLAGNSSNKEDYLDLKVPDYMSRICLGELRQHINNGNLDLTEMQYMKIIAGKTAALFEASYYAGAVISKCDDRTLKNFMRLGEYTGMILQLTDDCMDYETTMDIAKKPVQSDFEQGVVTLPLIYTLKNVSGFKGELKQNKLSTKQINKVVEQSGGLKCTHEAAKKYYEKSKQIIDKLEANDDKKKRLNLILDKVYRLS
jgi:Geranylgeranyl pyrophosphate synthase